MNTVQVDPETPRMPLRRAIDYPPVGSMRPNRVNWSELTDLLIKGFPRVGEVVLLQNVPSTQAKRAARPATIRQNMQVLPEAFGVELVAIQLDPRKDGRKSGWNLVARRIERSE